MPKDSFFSSKGLNNRMKGMYKKESTSTKIGYAVLFGCSAAVFLVFGALSAERASNANRINVDFIDDSRYYLTDESRF